MRVLVTAASRYGATGEIADVIGDELRGRGLDAVVAPPEEVEGVDGYDAVVIGSAVYAGHWLRPARELVGRSGGAIADLPVWLFSSGPVGDPPKPAEDPVDVEGIRAATAARDHRVFAGRIERRRLNFAERAVLLALRAPEGDFRDWDEVRAWASGIAAELGGGT